MRPSADPYNLNRFVLAQRDVYSQVQRELRTGRKESHWMWYIFPQLRGLGRSGMARQFGISGLDEARAYLQHPLLGPRLLECAETVTAIEGRSAREIFGSPDDVKLRSSATLFRQVLPQGNVFERLLAKYYAGADDPLTLEALSNA